MIDVGIVSEISYLKNRRIQKLSKYMSVVYASYALSVK